MKDAFAEGGQMPPQGRDLEEENKALRTEIERLQKVRERYVNRILC